MTKVLQRVLPAIVVVAVVPTEQEEALPGEAELEEIRGEVEGINVFSQDLLLLSTTVNKDISLYNNALIFYLTFTLYHGMKSIDARKLYTCVANLVSLNSLVLPEVHLYSSRGGWCIM